MQSSSDWLQLCFALRATHAKGAFSLSECFEPRIPLCAEGSFAGEATFGATDEGLLRIAYGNASQVNTTIRSLNNNQSSFLKAQVV